MKHLVFLAALVCVSPACGDRPFLAEPGRATAPPTIAAATGRPIDIDETFTAEEFCDFPILVEQIGKTNTIELRSGRAIVVLVVGTFSFVVDQEGNLVQSLQGIGQRTDMCERLA